ncbi:mucin-5AC-like isoform X2 [Physella acuta]|nr:mucin-5AC-like isoform X2 [Physella acuta]
MSTLLDFLREARLEQFYPAFRANGITQSEALINLGMPEFFALGITASEDKRRLVELVNIIKSVHNSGSPIFQQRNMGFRHRQQSNINTSDETSQTRNMRSRQATRSTAFQSPQTPQRLEPSRDVIVQDRVPNFSVSSYMDMLRCSTESSSSEESDNQVEDEQTINRILSNPSGVRNSISKGPAVERIKHSKMKSYNYGVHKVSAPTKSKTPKLGANRFVGEEKIKVCVRKRPLTKKEQKGKEEDIVTVESTNMLVINEPKLAVDLTAFTLQHEFLFDEVFDENCSNEDVYIRAARPLISCVFNGGTATCFAYGQTGAGKTHTMLGSTSVPGLYLLAGQDIFSIIQSGKYGRNLHVWVSFFEIYCGQLFDLLNRRNRLHAREDGSHQVCIAGLTETEATSVDSLVQTLEYGNSVRSKGATGVNPDSSRSHAILQLDIRDSQDNKLGKISFIDLAGSERASDVTDTDKQTRMEGAEINQSLLALKECIRSIDQESRHTPFRQSKLTHILKDSFVGNSRTCMIANISPSQSACENTINTLRYADRVKELRRENTRSSSVGHTMNLLMNIPPPAPTAFHPSNILSSSTPQRPASHSRRDRLNVVSDVVFDPTETPIRGHNLPKKSRAKEKHRESPIQGAKSRSETNAGSASPHIPPGTSTRFTIHATAASQGSSAPPPDASPSESDQTDTDSCNVTHPTHQKPGRQLPVARSTDTEFDFPTSDFNIVEDLNDLNRSGLPQKGSPTSTVPRGHAYRDSGDNAAAAAEDEKPAAPASNKRPPQVKPVLYKSTDPEVEASHHATSASSPSTATTKTPQPDILSPKISQHPPLYKRSFLEELVSSGESVDDDDLMAEEPAAPQPDDRQPSNTFPGKTPASKPSTLINVMTPVPALSSDLTQFTQRTVKSLEPPPVGTNDLSGKSPSSLPAQQPNFAIPENSTQIPGFKPSKLSSERVRSPFTKHSESPSPQPGNTQVTQKPRDKSPVIDHSSVKPVVFHLEGSSSKTQGASSEDLKSDKKVRHHSDSSDCLSLSKISQSPTGDASDDSTDSIRASFSDQGQGGSRHSGPGSMRKERSDPMLALDMQRKKQTLPDPQFFSKMLTRSNTPKGGRAHRDTGPKVVRNDLSSPSAGLSEPNLAADGSSDPKSQNLSGENVNPSQHHSPSSQLGFKLSDKPRSKGKQLPQVPTTRVEEKNHVSQGLNTGHISQHTPVKHNPAIVTEKLTSGAVFSPIHPQPVTSVGGKSQAEASTVSSVVLQPTPVSAMEGHPTELQVSSVVLHPTELQEARTQLVISHEDQLAVVTSLCKTEMKLLLNTKNASGKIGFDNYLRRVSDILQQKMNAIEKLQHQISEYYNSQGVSVSKPSATSHGSVT